ncbi:hypothetical protein WJX74_003329 [Apatococcus lobatus]|uniref:Uncharacterized protein n=1 Tax=Apatococcus lobatus TaxID=904363 RepID=A0AAW1RV70_9CHLO
MVTDISVQKSSDIISVPPALDKQVLLLPPVEGSGSETLLVPGLLTLWLSRSTSSMRAANLGRAEAFNLRQFNCVHMLSFSSKMAELHALSGL